MKKIREWMEPGYTKIAVYSIIAALIIFIACLIIYNSNDALTSASRLGMAVMKPLVLGLVIAYLLLPIVKLLEGKVFGWISRKRLRRNLSVLLIYVLVAAALVVAIVLLILMITKSISSIELSLSSLQSFLDSLQADFAEFWKIIEDKLADFNINLGSVGKAAAGLFGNLKAGASTLLFAAIFSVYFLLDSGISKYWKKAARVLLKEKTRDSMKIFLADADQVFSGYIRGQVLDALIMGSMVTIAFNIAEIPYAGVVGILTGLGNLIPFIGPIVGFASLIIVCLTKLAFDKLIIGACILAIVMFIDGNFINPRLLSANVEVHPILVFLALIAGGEVGGIVGMLVAVPCAALLKQQFEKYVNKRDQQNQLSIAEGTDSNSADGGGASDHYMDDGNSRHIDDGSTT